jgi:peptide-methionine (S)-S-oxide reductase
LVDPGRGARRVTGIVLAACAGSVALVLAGTSPRPAGARAPFPEPSVDDRLVGSEGQSGASGPISVVLAGGCFWGIQAVFQHVKGVVSATSGYAGGPARSARYELVSTGRTGHAESVNVAYDPARITYGQLLKVFFAVAHDPTELNRQGPDRGPQYRSVVFYANETQHRIARAYIEQLNGAGTFSRPIVTQVVPFEGFYAAEPYHQDYFDHHPFAPYIMINDRPKVERLRKLYPEIYSQHHP